MNKLPTKQIYLLVIIIVGIIALSIYSTYAIFTFEGSTSNIVSLYTPNTLEISNDMYEYKQIKVDKNSYVTVDLDIYNSFDYDLCFSIWYKVVGKENIDKAKIKVFILNDTLSSGIIETVKSYRTTILIINDNDNVVKVNIGINTAKNEETCSLNISEDKSIISNKINSYQELSKYIIDNNGKFINQEEGYNIYNTSDLLIELNDDKIYVSDKFTYHNEIFKLEQYDEIELKDIVNYESNEDISYYTCIDGFECRFLYKINKVNKKTIKDEITVEDKDVYSIVDYDIYKGYFGGASGVKKINNDYIYYGDNPNNFVYYNCVNELDVNTCELWRILGTYYDELNDEYYTKIIKNDSIGLYAYDEGENLDFEKSSLYEYLDMEFKLINDSYLKSLSFKQDYISSINQSMKQIGYFKNEIISSISVMSLVDYLNSSLCNEDTIDKYAEDCLNNNYLNLNDGVYWTNTREYQEIITDDDKVGNIEITNDKIYSVSSLITTNNIIDKLNVRPVVYLKERVLLTDGDGTLEQPFIIR